MWIINYDDDDDDEEPAPIPTVRSRLPVMDFCFYPGHVNSQQIWMKFFICFPVILL